MASISNYLENKLIDHVFRGTTYTAPSTMYIALYTAAPSDSGGGTEVTGGSYARASISANQASWVGTHGTATGASSGTSGTTSNAVEITFNAPTGNWGQITHLGIFDADTDGNLLFWGALTNPKNINNGDDAPSVIIGALTFQLDN